VVAVSTHNPMRPSWECGGCGDPWPCVTRRRELLAEYERARVSLVVYVTGQFLDAVQDLPSVPSGALYDRFLGWLT
jgi:hypothetical protein